MTEEQMLEHLADLHAELVKLSDAIDTNQPTNRRDAAAE